MTGMRTDPTPPRRPGPVLPAPGSRGAALALLAVTWPVIFGAVVGIGWLLTHPLDDSVGALDRQVARWLAGRRTPLLTDVAEGATFLGETATGVVALVIVAAAFSLARRSPMPALYVLLVAGGLAGIYRGATALVPRDRPPVRILDTGLVADHSFPSGHVATASAVCGTLLVLTWVCARAATRWVMPLLSLPLGTVLGRMYQGAHHLSDVLTTLVYATVWILLVGLLLRGQAPRTARAKVRWHGRRPGPSSPARRGQARRGPHGGSTDDRSQLPGPAAG